MLKLYQYEISPFCDKVRRILHLKGQPYETHEVTLWEASSGFLSRLNRGGRVPVLDHDGQIVCDSTDIAAYLERVFPEPALYPSDPRERAQVHVLEDWADESLYFYEMYLRFKLGHNADRWVAELAKYDNAIMRALASKLVPRVVKDRLENQGLGTKTLDVVLRELGSHLQAIDGWLADGDWLVGDRISVSDVSAFVQLDCMRQVEEGQRALEPHPRVRAWLDRVDGQTGRRPPMP
jgi:glutathione S-transferase